MEYHLTTPLKDEDIAKLKAGDTVKITGVIYTARDAAHARLVKLLEDHKADKADNSRKIWTIYVFLVWYNVYFVEEDFKPINDEWVKNRIKTA